jgi:DNA-binding protein YbaB
MASLESLSPEEQKRFANISHAALTHTDPKIRKQAKQLIKSMNPTWSDPELEIDAARDNIVKEVTDPLRKEINDLKELMARKELESDWEKARVRIEAAGDLKLEDVKKVMVDKKIADVDTAAEFLRAQNQLAAPTSAHIIPKELPPDLNKLLGNQTATKQHQHRNLVKAMDEVIARRRTGQALPA